LLACSGKPLATLQLARPVDCAWKRFFTCLSDETLLTSLSKPQFTRHGFRRMKAIVRFPTMDNSRDNGSSYLLEVVGRLRRGDAHASVAAYLEETETGHIGLTRRASTGERAEATVAAISHYLESLH
jgi:hypothetical protein